MPLQDLPGRHNKGFIHFVPLLVSLFLILGVVVVGAGQDFDIRSKAKEVVDRIGENLPPGLMKGSTPPPVSSPSPVSSPNPTSGKGSGGGGGEPSPITSVAPPSGDEPYPSAPLCPDSGMNHDNSKFHTLWDSNRRCHYDHEHGTNPFTSEVLGAFPGFDLRALLGGVEIGNTNLTGAMENTMKHGGFKWDAVPYTPEGCAVIESGEIAVNGALIQYHAFGQQGIEFETSNHSTAALVRLCRPGQPQDVGYLYTVMHQEYGERCVPYQGSTAPYPNSFQPAYDCSFGPYFTTSCLNDSSNECPLSRDEHVNTNRDASSIWTGKTTGGGLRPSTAKLFTLLFRIRDQYQALDRRDFAYPFTYLWLCSSDGGATYNPARCRYNNSATKVHEVAGRIPASWDNLSGFDTDSRVGRITAQGYTNRFGELSQSCTTPGINCHPVKMVNAFVGFYSSELSNGKVSNDTPENTPERDVYFCNGRVCSETSSGAVPSGWIGPNN